MRIRIGMLSFCFLLVCFKAISQPFQTNQTALEKRIAAAPDDTSKVLLYVELAGTQVAQNSFDEALATTQKGLLLATRLKYVHGIVLSYMRRGGVYEEVTRDYPKAISYYKEGIRVAEANHSYTDINDVYGCILNMYYYISDYPSAMTIAQKGLAYAEQRNDKEKLAHYNNQLGFIYLEQEKPAESIKYYRQYLKLALQTGNQMLVADSYSCLADVYLLEKDYNTALHYLFTGLNIYKRMDSADMVNKTQLAGKKDRVAHTLYKISKTYKLQGHYQLAIRYALNVFTYRNGYKVPSYNQYDRASYYVNTGEIYTALKDYGPAMWYLNKGLSISKAIIHREDMRDAYSGLSKIYALQKRYDSAYHYQLLYAALKDSMVNEKSSRAVEQVRSSFESDKKDKEIALLHQRQKLKETESEKKSLLLNIMIIFFTLLAVISYLILHIRNNNKQQRVAQEKQMAIQDERHRISGDMHDDIGTGLSTMLIYVNMLKSKLNGQLEYPDIERVALLGNELVAQMKEIVWSLNPGNDSVESLLVFIRQYFSQLFEPLPYRTHIIFPVSIPDVVLKGVIRRNVYLCIKEALNNVIKHANADRVELSIQLNQDKLIINVRDNGAGFPDNPDDKFFSNGLKNMQYRMSQIGGKFQYYNDNGAVISIELNLTGVPKRVVAL